MIRPLLVLLLMLGLPGGATAAVIGSDFKISVFPAPDITPPPTPTITNAEPVTSSQIDVSWGAVSDDVALRGYVLSRDGTPIATTSLVTYSDTGLQPTTTYTYTVRAFDYGNNYSSSSVPVATTTLAPPTPPAPAPSATDADPTVGTVVRLQLEDFTLTAAATSTRFHWRTNAQGRYTLRWGRTNSYELGYVINDVYRLEHITEIADLEPGTTYAFELLGITPGGAETVLQRGEFTTAVTGGGQLPVPNVRRLTATAAGDDVLLRWHNPNATAFERIRVVRSPHRFPSGPQAGRLVYQGRGERVWDRAALATYGTQYYAVYTLTADGRVSSGAVVTVVRPNVTGEQAPEITGLPEPDLPPRSVVPDTSDVFAATGTPLLPLHTIRLTQSGQVYTFADETIVLSTQAPVRLSLAATATPATVQSLVATLLDPTDHRRSYSFLLRLNRDRSAYEALLAPLGVAGVSQLELAVYDFSAQVVSRYRHPVTWRTPSPTRSVVFPDLFMPYAPFVFGSVLAACLLMWVSAARGRGR